MTDQPVHQAVPLPESEMPLTNEDFLRHIDETLNRRLSEFRKEFRDELKTQFVTTDVAKEMIEIALKDRPTATEIQGLITTNINAIQTQMDMFFERMSGVANGMQLTFTESLRTISLKEVELDALKKMMLEGIDFVKQTKASTDALASAMNTVASAIPSLHARVDNLEHRNDTRRVEVAAQMVKIEDNVNRLENDAIKRDGILERLERTSATLKEMAENTQKSVDQLAADIAMPKLILKALWTAAKSKPAWVGLGLLFGGTGLTYWIDFIIKNLGQ